jgi:hypothetical protein
MSNIKEKNINSDVPPRLLDDNETYLGNGTIVAEGMEATITNPDELAHNKNNKKKDQ